MKCAIENCNNEATTYNIIDDDLHCEQHSTGDYHRWLDETKND